MLLPIVTVASPGTGSDESQVEPQAISVAAGFVLRKLQRAHHDLAGAPPSPFPQPSSFRTGDTFFSLYVTSTFKVRSHFQDKTEKKKRFQYQPCRQLFFSDVGYSIGTGDKERGMKPDRAEFQSSTLPSLCPETTVGTVAALAGR